MRRTPSAAVIDALAAWHTADNELRRAAIEFIAELQARRFGDRTDRALEALRQHIVEHRDRTPAAIHDAASTLLDERETRCDSRP